MTDFKIDLLGAIVRMAVITVFVAIVSFTGALVGMLSGFAIAVAQYPVSGEFSEMVGPLVRVFGCVGTFLSAVLALLLGNAAADEVVRDVRAQFRSDNE